MTERKKMSFTTAMLDYFGKKPGQNSMEFIAEMKALTDEDKNWFRSNLPKVGYDIVAA